MLFRSYVTVYFGSAKVSRHRYSSHIIKYLIIVAYDTSAIYLSVSEHSSHRVSLGRPKDTFVSSLSCSVKPNYTSPSLGSVSRTIRSSRLYVVGSASGMILRLVTSVYQLDEPNHILTSSLIWFGEPNASSRPKPNGASARLISIMGR